MRTPLWRTLPFEEAVHSRGSGPSGLPQSEWKDVGKYPVIGQGEGDVEGWSDRSDLLITPAPALVLYGGHTRRAKHVSAPFVPGPNVKILRPNSALDSRFLFYFLLHLPIESKGYADHFPLVRQSRIPLPDLLEQQRIVGILDEAFAAIAIAEANTDRNVANARAVFESHLHTVFTQGGEGWTERSLDEMCVIGDGNHSSNYPKKDELVEAGVPFIRATNLVAGRVSGSDMRFLSPAKHEQLKKGHLKTGDVLFTNRGAIGTTAIVDEAYDNANLNSQIAWLRCRDGLNNRFLFYVLNSEGMKKHFEASKSGAALQQFTIKQIKELLIPIPPKNSQFAIVSTLDSIAEATQCLESLSQRKLAALDALKKSLLHQAFAGLLTTQAAAMLA